MISTKINNNDSVCLIESLTEQYRAAYGYTPNEPLKLIWRQLEQSFSTSLTSVINNKIQVLNPPTGTGKTHCLAEWCKYNISYDSDHSVLIVVRTMDQADKMADSINLGAAIGIAISHHTKKDVSLEEAQDTPILIITAEAYKNLLEARLGYSGVDFRSQKLLTFRGGLRQLTVIDEAFSFVKNWASDLEKLKQIRAYIPKNISDKYPLELAFLSKVIDRLEEVNKLEKIHFNKANVEYDFDALLLDMRSEKLDRNTVGEDSIFTQTRLSRRVKDALVLLSKISEGFALVQRNGRVPV